MTKEASANDPKQKPGSPSHVQTEKPWKGNPEKEQRNDDAKPDIEKWQETKTH